MFGHFGFVILFEIRNSDLEIEDSFFALLRVLSG